MKILKVFAWLFGSLAWLANAVIGIPGIMAIVSVSNSYQGFAHNSLIGSAVVAGFAWLFALIFGGVMIGEKVFG